MVKWRVRMLLYVWNCLPVRLPQTPQEAEDQQFFMLDSGKSISSHRSHHSMLSVGSLKRGVIIPSTSFTVSPSVVYGFEILLILMVIELLMSF